MLIQFDGAKEGRKELVRAIADVTNEPSVYQGAPGFAYRIGAFTVLAGGEVEVDDFADGKWISMVVQGLRGRGFPTRDERWSAYEDSPGEADVGECLETAGAEGIALVFPKEDMDELAIRNVKKIVEGKGWLLRLALETDSLPVEEGEGALRFPWLPSCAPPELTQACAHLIAAIIKLAKKQRRVTFTEKETDNPKYALRCFLLRLGFIGPEYKDVRNILTAGVPGNGAYRSRPSGEAVAENAQEHTDGSTDTNLDVNSAEDFGGSVAK
ncbi:MAG: hypothetical protein VB099_20440 [Candidatus Limiplasma sp.]|nr:hypothetical protein [Candidatus Limiplasma sp.]